jgi:signal transduction histidine kinase
MNPYNENIQNQTDTETNVWEQQRQPKRRTKKLSAIMPVINSTVEYDNNMNNQVPESLPNNIYENNSGNAIPLVEMNVRMTFIIDVLEPILSVFYAIAEERGISLVVEGDDNDDLPGIMACEQALQEAFTNVLDNAFKYVVVAKRSEQTNNGSDTKWNPSPKVRVRFVSNRRPLGSGVTIYVEDNGPGIPPNERSNIFNRGVRGESTQHLVEGTGIGLNIAKTLMESMGGTLDIVDNTSSNTNAKRRPTRSIYDGTTVQMTLFRSNSNK